MNTKYDPKKIEAEWQKEWEISGNPHPKKKKKYYVLDMFPYPSGDGIHMGHVENYTATDIVARYRRLSGFDVMHPIGWDAFGLPAENFAIKTGIHPNKKTHQNIKNFTRQIKSLGISYDWDRELDTSSPEYYRFTQWMFLFLYKNGLAYKKKAHVNWCESCRTVLANEQVENGACERCKNAVIQKDLEQWFFKITDFVEDIQTKSGKKISGLLSGLERIDWPTSTKAAQKNWIGRSEGTIVKFKIKNEKLKIQNRVSEVGGRKLEADEYVEIFTTRVDTIYGCTYVVVAPEHPFISGLLDRHSRGGGNPDSADVLDPRVKPDDDSFFKIANVEEIKNYIESVKKKTDLERTELSREKTGVKLEGIEAVNPFTGESVPVYVADYVLGNYGTGSVMAVPAHDERDFAFAKKYGLPMRQSIQSNQELGIKNQEKKLEAFVEDGVLVDSGEFTGLKSEKAREKMTAWLAKKKLGERKVSYRLRDWLISRQRYWGAPIPIVYCDRCGMVPVPEKDLPVKLPTDVDFRPTGESPLVRSKSFHRVRCPKCGTKARRESDTMDTFVCSSWYYLRFADPRNAKRFADSKKLRKFLPVDFYMGGAEHTVLHLLYARFFTKALARYGYLDFDEPFLTLRHQGMILAEDGRKMSKSLGNVVNPDDIVRRFGADTLRLYEMFLGPLEEAKAWNPKAIVGMRRFLEKAWKIKLKIKNEKLKMKAEERDLSILLHKTIKKVSEDIEEMRFNTAISALMILVNEMEKAESVAWEDFEKFLILLSPFAPHIAEELWNLQGNKQSIMLQCWPKADPKFLKEETTEVVVQVNGKLRARLRVSVGVSQEDVECLAREEEVVKKYLDKTTIRKVIFVPDRLVNFVV